MNDLVEFLEARIAEDEAKSRALLANTQEGYDINAYAQQMLAECAAKRAVIALYKPEDLESSDRGAYFYAEGTGDAVKALAAVYKDHPGYRQEWTLG